jgi:hypothetical protein
MGDEVDDDVSTGLAQADRHGLADARVGTGHQGFLPFQNPQWFEAGHHDFGEVIGLLRRTHRWYSLVGYAQPAAWTYRSVNERFWLVEVIWLSDLSSRSDAQRRDPVPCRRGNTRGRGCNP